MSFDTDRLQLELIESARLLSFSRGNKPEIIRSIKALGRLHLAAQLADCVGKPYAVVCMDNEHFGQVATLERIERFEYFVRTDTEEFVTTVRHLRSAAEEQAWLELVETE